MIFVYASIFMTLLWTVQLFTANAAIVDVGWTLTVVAAHAWLAWHGNGDLNRSAMLVCAIAIWGLRLAGHLYLTRVRGNVPEDGRYRKLREEWGSAFQPKLWVFFQMQAVAAIALAWPFGGVYRNSSPNVGVWEWAGLGLFAVAVAGVAASDQQLHDYKAGGGKGVCEKGLWAYSRHPNYFFESLVWTSWALFAQGSPGAGWAWLAPGSILLLILFVTGIPPTEQQSLRSKGEAYRDYQRRVSVFVPWFRKP